MGYEVSKPEHLVWKWCIKSSKGNKFFWSGKVSGFSMSSDKVSVRKDYENGNELALSLLWYFLLFKPAKECIFIIKWLSCYSNYKPSCDTAIVPKKLSITASHIRINVPHQQLWLFQSIWVNYFFLYSWGDEVRTCMWVLFVVTGNGSPQPMLEENLETWMLIKDRRWKK